MKKFTKKISAALLAGLLIGSTVACGKKTSEEAGKTSEAVREVTKSEEDKPQDTEAPEAKAPVQGNLSEKGQALLDYLEAYMAGDEEKMLANLAPIAGEGALPTKHYENVKGDPSGTMGAVLDSIENKEAKTVIVEEDADTYTINLYDASNKMVESIAPFGTLFSESGKVLVGIPKYTFYMPYLTDIYFNGKKVEFNTVEDQDQKKQYLEILNLPQGEYEITFGDSYLQFDSIPLEVNINSDSVMDTFGTKEGKDLVLKPEVQDKAFQAVNQATEDLFKAFNAADPTGKDITVAEMSDEAKDKAAQSFLKMNGMNRGIMAGERVYYPAESSEAKSFEVKDKDTFLIRFEIKYDAGSAKNLAHTIEAEVAYKGDNAIEITSIDFS